MGAAALLPDDSVCTPAPTLLSLDAGWHITQNRTTTMTLLNALNVQANDIRYYYASRLRGEAAPVAYVHFHPLEPRTWRLGLSLRF